MSEIVGRAVRVLNERIEGKSMPGSVKFVIEEEGAVRIDGTEARADDAPADCTMTASADTFEGILDGSLNPTAAFMSGRLKVEGDMGLAIKLGTILG
ncbi:SCP2 sterol-binding domain-containing protein [soil metagenome]